MLKKKSTDKESYPPDNNILENIDADVPESLKNFLRLPFQQNDIKDMERHKMKGFTIAHAILAAFHSHLYNSMLHLAVDGI